MPRRDDPGGGRDPGPGGEDIGPASVRLRRDPLALDGDGDPIHEQMAGLMRSFRAGLFAGGDAFDQIHDNLDLERWFRLPKGHERRIHGHRHAGVRIVQEGPTLVHALDAHHTHPEPFGVDDLLPYRSARGPGVPVQAIHRRKVMRKARSKTKRPNYWQTSSDDIKRLLAACEAVEDKTGYLRPVVEVGRGTPPTKDAGFVPSMT